MASTCARHPKTCPFEAAAREAFDAYVAAVSRHSAGEIGSQQLREARAAYDDARDERNRQCVGLPEAGSYEADERAGMRADA